MDATRKRLTARTLLWGHVAAVTCVTVALFRADGDLHAVQPPILYLLVIPATLSLYQFPPLVLYIVVREPHRWCWPVVAEALLLWMHVAVVSAGFSRWSGTSSAAEAISDRRSQSAPAAPRLDVPSPSGTASVGQAVRPATGRHFCPSEEVARPTWLFP